MPLILTAGLLCLTGWFVLGMGGLWDIYQLRQRFNRQQTHIAELRARKEWLQVQLADLKEKKDLALESAARGYGLVAPGETVYEIKVEPKTP
jgi:cell division protein FtsB